MDKNDRKQYFALLMATLVPFLLGLLLSLVIGFSNANRNTLYIDVVRVFSGISVFALASVSIIELVAHFFNKDADWNTFIVSIGILIMMLTCSDAFYVVNFKPEVAQYEEFARLASLVYHSGWVLVSIFMLRFFRKNYEIPFARYEIVLSIAIPLVGLALFYPLSIIEVEYIVVAFELLTVFFWLFKCAFFALKSKRVDSPFVLSFLILGLCSSLALSNPLGHSFPQAISATGLCSFFGVIIDFIFYGIYLNFVIMTTRSAYKKEEFERKANLLQGAVLKQQIKPHFIFNVLNAIKFAYREDQKKGELAMDLFSKYLRSSTEASSVFMVPLSKELDLISWYIELENLKVSKPYVVIYNIDAFDFEVPYFGLQPLVENAIKYGKLDKKKDGYVQIDTTEKDDSYQIIVSDNGAGFDASSVQKDSYGIGNTRSRFELLLNASFQLESKPGEGTTITITIPKGESPYASDRRR